MPVLKDVLVFVWNIEMVQSISSSVLKFCILFDDIFVIVGQVGGILSRLLFEISTTLLCMCVRVSHLL